jgi:hypothetical protein
MRRFVAFGLVAALALSVPSGAMAAGRRAEAAGQARTGSLTGSAKDSKGQKLAGATVRIRNTATGSIAAEIVSDAAGAFTAGSLAPATYVVEVISNGVVIGLSPAIAVTAGVTATVAVTATAVGAVAAAGAAAGGVGMFGLGAAATSGVLGAAAAGAILGVRAAVGDASPSGQ